ncbi:MAG: hypothetical protein AB1758_24265, partial [Candidatus Eremiobacterota bacterium]
MLKILQRRLPIQLRPEEAYQVQQSLQARFNSLLAGVRLEYLRRLGLDREPRGLFTPPEGSSLAAGELFMPEPGTIFYIKCGRNGDHLEAGAISRSRDADFSNFFSEVRDAVLEVHGATGDWLAQEGRDLSVEDARAADVNVSQKELEASREIMNERSKHLLERLARSESTLFKQLEEEHRREAAGLLNTLEELDLVRKDYAVLDPDTGQQILRVASRETIEEYSQKGFNWFVSGKSVTDMEVDEVLSCTPFCRSLLENDQWLLLLLLGTLKSLGVGNDDVQVCQQPGAPIQLFLNLNQQNFLIVLTNGKLTLDDAYLVSAQISAYGLKHVLVISNQKISKLMKHHLSQTNPEVGFSFIDSLNDLEETVQGVFMERQREYLRNVLSPLSELTPVKIDELVIQRMAPRADAEAHEPVAAPSLSTPAFSAQMFEPEPAPGFNGGGFDLEPAAPEPEPASSEGTEDFLDELGPEEPGIPMFEEAESEPVQETYEVAAFFEDLIQNEEEPAEEEAPFEEPAAELEEEP